jgi:hypothetical protein
MAKTCAVVTLDAGTNNVAGARTIRSDRIVLLFVV